MSGGSVHRKDRGMSKVVIIGGGPAGMLAGIYAARKGNEVHLFEKNEKLGKKIIYHRKRQMQCDE
jgi:predicted flavoprotein YhiN